ncbi:MAG: hypothetical protein IJD13_05130 [Oscillospiraceae bacterium]|nr:hypothetical protein [Oscillospiraceae bacterium]
MSKAKSSSKKMMVFGAVVLVFALIGLVSTVLSAARGIAGLLDNSKQKEEFEWLITPVVMQDPSSFENPDKMTNTTIITAGVWRLIMNEDISRYPADDFNFVTVPQSDIEVQIKSLFGDVSYVHETVGDTELLITYDSENKCYIFPAVPHVMPYTPDVQEIKVGENGNVTLTVGYIPPGLVWEGDTDGRKYQPEPDKIMEYVLTPGANKDEYRIYSISNVATGQDLHNNMVGPSIESSSQLVPSEPEEESEAVEDPFLPPSEESGEESAPSDEVSDAVPEGSSEESTAEPSEEE